MTNKRQCGLCGEDIEDAPAIHNKAVCENTELLKGREEIKRLKRSIDDWRNAWFRNREIIGELWWDHPAIMDDKQREYYQTVKNNQQGST